MSALPPKADMCGATRDAALGQKRTSGRECMSTCVKRRPPRWPSKSTLLQCTNSQSSGLLALVALTPILRPSHSRRYFPCCLFGLPLCTAGSLASIFVLRQALIWADRDPRWGSHHCRLSLQTSHPAGVDPNHCPAFGTGELQENGTTLCKRRRSAMPNNGDVPSDWRAAPRSQRRPDCGGD